MTNNPYLIAVDLDGTLFYDFDTFDILSTTLLKELAKEHYVVIATGRPFRSSSHYYDILELNTPIINYNGALVQNKKDKNFKKKYIYVAKDDVIKFINDNEEHLINIFCEIEDTIFLWKEQKEIYPFLHLDGGILNIGNFQDILYANPNGALGFAKYSSVDALTNYVDKTFNGLIRLRFWNLVESYAIFELYNVTTSKGQAILDVARYYNIPKERIIAIGDGHNDIEMIECAAYGVAMGNAHPELLEKATFKTLSIKENGVYKFLKEFFKK